MTFKQFGYEGKPKTCLWCGIKLRRNYNTEWEDYRKVPRRSRCCKTPVFRDGSGLHRCEECDAYIDISHRRVVSREYLGLGAYNDGFFCSLGCGYCFGVRFAELGNKLKGK